MKLLAVLNGNVDWSGRHEDSPDRPRESEVPGAEINTQVVKKRSKIATCDYGHRNVPVMT